MTTTLAPNDLADYAVTVENYPTTLQLTAAEAARRGLYTDGVELPYAERFGIESGAVHVDHADIAYLQTAETTELDSDAEALDAAVTDVETELASVIADETPDFTALSAAVAALRLAVAPLVAALVVDDE